MSVKNRAGSCRCCFSCEYLSVTPADALAKMTIENAPDGYVWDGTEIPPGASILTRRLMPEDHYSVEILVTKSGTGTFPIKFETQHATYERDPLPATRGVSQPVPFVGLPPARFVYHSMVSLTSMFDNIEWFDDKQSLTERQWTNLDPRPVLPGPTSSTKFFVTDGLAWSSGNQLPQGAITSIYDAPVHITSLHRIESPTIEILDSYGTALAPERLVITNTGTTAVFLSSIEVLRIRGLVAEDGTKSLSFLDPLPDDPVPNPTCEEHFPECWDVEQPLPPMEVAIVPKASIQTGKFVSQGCSYLSNWTEGGYASRNIPISQAGNLEQPGTTIHSGTDRFGQTWDLIKYPDVQELTYTDITTGAMHDNSVGVSLNRIPIPELNEEDEEYYPWEVNFTGNARTETVSIWGWRNATTGAYSTSPFSTFIGGLWQLPSQRAYQTRLNDLAQLANTQVFETKPFTASHEFVFPLSINTRVTVRAFKERIYWIRINVSPAAKFVRFFRNTDALAITAADASSAAGFNTTSFPTSITPEPQYYQLVSEVSTPGTLNILTTATW